MLCNYPEIIRLSNSKPSELRKISFYLNKSSKHTDAWSSQLSKLESAKSMFGYEQEKTSMSL